MTSITVTAAVLSDVGLPAPYAQSQPLRLRPLQLESPTAHREAETAKAHRG